MQIVRGKAHSSRNLKASRAIQGAPKRELMEKRGANGRDLPHNISTEASRSDLRVLKDRQSVKHCAKSGKCISLICLRQLVDLHQKSGLTKGRGDYRLI